MYNFGQSFLELSIYLSQVSSIADHILMVKGRIKAWMMMMEPKQIYALVIFIPVV